MISKQTKDSGKGPAKDGALGPFDFAAATSIGFAMAAQAVDMWFGVMTGMAKASQEMIEPHLKANAGEPAAYAPSEKPFEVTAKSALRTVVAELERTSQEVAEVAVEMLGGATTSSASKSDADVSAKSAEIVAFKSKPEKAPAKRRQRPAPRRDAASTAPGPVSAAEVEATVAAPVEAPAIAAEPPAPATTSETVAQVASATSGSVAAEVAKTASFTIMPEDFRAPKAIDKPEALDDLKLLAGVGPKLETVLNGLGVWTFAQVAAWEPEEIAWVDDYLGLNGRIRRDDWTGQARSLSDGVPAPN